MLDKNEVICLIDGVAHKSDSGMALSKLSKYLKRVHSMTLEKYVLQYYYNGQAPYCACGCGTFVSFYKSRYLTYYSNHSSLVPVSDEKKERLRKAAQVQGTFAHRLSLCGYTQEELGLMFIDFTNFSVNFADLTTKYRIDKRTLKKLWCDMGLIPDKRAFEYICKRHQHVWQNKNNKAGGRQMIDETLLVDIYRFLKETKAIYTLAEISNKFSLPISGAVLYKRLCENFGEAIIDEHLRLGITSKPEAEFFNILKFFYGKRIQRNFKLQGKHYDFILDGRILIEFDGDYWHSQLKNIVNDKEKDEIALKNNFAIFRIKESEAKDITVLIKIDTLLKKIAQQV